MVDCEPVMTWRIVLFFHSAQRTHCFSRLIRVQQLNEMFFGIRIICYANIHEYEIMHTETFTSEHSIMCVYINCKLQLKNRKFRDVNVNT